MADLVDAAEAAAPAPPLTKASPPESMRPTTIDDTPTEPATSPRMLDNPGEWPVELQLPTGQLVHEKNLRGVLQGLSSMMVHGLQQNMKKNCVKDSASCVVSCTAVLDEWNTLRGQVAPLTRSLLSDMDNYCSDYAALYISVNGHRQWTSLGQLLIHFIATLVCNARAVPKGPFRTKIGICSKVTIYSEFTMDSNLLLQRDFENIEIAISGQ